MNPFNLIDDIGPEQIIHLSNRAAQLEAIVVVDNTACGPAIGGCRMAPDVTLDECARLARAMTLKNVAAGLPHGGGKSVIKADPHMPQNEKENLMRAFAQRIKDVSGYIVGPDMGTNETFMSYVQDEIGRAVGLPRTIGGIPLDEIGATGLGVCASALAAEEFTNLTISESTVAIQGFGAVGQHAARFLSEKGATVVAVSDSKHTIVQPNGLDVDALIQHKEATGVLEGFTKAELHTRDEIIKVVCDIWIPAARPDIITMDNVAELKCKLIVQGANIPIAVEAEETLHKKGITNIPDYIANAGGVICASVEYHQGTEADAEAAIVEKISRNTQEILLESKKLNLSPRSASDQITKKRLSNAMDSCRWHT